jgi:hypothetical protein
MQLAECIVSILAYNDPNNAFHQVRLVVDNATLSLVFKDVLQGFHIFEANGSQVRKRATWHHFIKARHQTEPIVVAERHVESEQSP